MAEQYDSRWRPARSQRRLCAARVGVARTAGRGRDQDQL